MAIMAIIPIMVALSDGYGTRTMITDMKRIIMTVTLSVITLILVVLMAL